MGSRLADTKRRRCPKPSALVEQLAARRFQSPTTAAQPNPASTEAGATPIRHARPWRVPSGRGARPPSPPPTLRFHTSHRGLKPRTTTARHAHAWRRRPCLRSPVPPAPQSEPNPAGTEAGATPGPARQPVARAFRPRCSASITTVHAPLSHQPSRAEAARHARPAHFAVAQASLPAVFDPSQHASSSPTSPARRPAPRPVRHANPWRVPSGRGARPPSPPPTLRSHTSHRGLKPRATTVRLTSPWRRRPCLRSPIHARSPIRARPHRHGGRRHASSAC